MNVLIASSLRDDGGYEEKDLTESLRKETEKLGHKVDHFYLPYARDMLALPEAVASMRLLDVFQTEVLVTVGFPACFIPHENKRSFLFSSASALFEYWDTEYGILGSKQYFYIREFVNNAEIGLGRDAKSVFCGSELLASDLAARSGINSRVFYPGTDAPENGSSPDAGKPFFVAETGLYPEDRIELALEAFKESAKSFSLAVYVPDTKEMYMEALERMIGEENLESSVTVFRERLPRSALRNSAGYLALGHALRNIPGGAMAAAEEGCPVVAFSDAGAILELGKRGAFVETCGVSPRDLSDLMKKCASFQDGTKKISAAAAADMRELARAMVEE